jgi:hypothetical protein
LAKTSVRDRDGVVAPSDVLKGLDFAEPSPPTPDPVLQWIATEETLHVKDRC